MIRSKIEMTPEIEGIFIGRPVNQYQETLGMSRTSTALFEADTEQHLEK